MVDVHGVGLSSGAPPHIEGKEAMKYLVCLCVCLSGCVTVSVAVHEKDVTAVVTRQATGELSIYLERIPEDADHTQTVH